MLSMFCLRVVSKRCCVTANKTLRKQQLQLQPQKLYHQQRRQQQQQQKQGIMMIQMVMIQQHLQHHNTMNATLQQQYSRYCRFVSSLSSSTKSNPTTSRSSGSRSIGRIIGMTFLAMCSSCAWYVHTYIADGTMNGLYRSFVFYSYGVPKYILYRYHMIFNPNNDPLWEKLHKDTSISGKQIIYQLQGFYIKCGQMIASNIGNAFPLIWQDTMSIFQDQCPYQDFNTVVLPTIQSELYNTYNITNIYDVFESIEPIPIGSASIGQVHRAVLKVPIPGNNSSNNNNNNNKNTEFYTKQNVVIKICYPNVEQQLRGDVRTLKTFAQIAQPVHVPAFDEIEKQFATEFDYSIEAQHLHTVRTNLIEAGLCATTNTTNSSTSRNRNEKSVVCIIPKPYEQYCTKRVLVMEEIVGEKFIDAIRHDVERRLKLLGKQQSMDELVPKRNDNNSTNNITNNNNPTGSSSSNEQLLPRLSATEFDRINTMLYWKHLVSSFSNSVHRWTVGWFLYNKNTDTSTDNTKSEEDEVDVSTTSSSSSSFVPLLNHAKLIDDLIYVHGHEVLVDGIFNSDPHPGNILLCRNKDTGKPSLLGLIDYGQVKKLTKPVRHLFARLIIALANDDHDEIIHVMTKAGYKSKYMNSNNIYRYSKVCYDEDNKQLTFNLHIQLFMEHLQSIDPIYELPTEFICIGRTSLILRGIAHSLQQSRSIAKSWKPIAERVLREDI